MMPVHETRLLQRLALWLCRTLTGFVYNVATIPVFFSEHVYIQPLQFSLNQLYRPFDSFIDSLLKKYLTHIHPTFTSQVFTF